ncbi:unnamed protein product [Strongylus vulgaris]|uniref:Serpentine receptor class gamma n=1 Tax=Strongylus vulgaris TaxID=40348 RepID=A0A3P7J7J1_STRVU|nr:unnamed protein product [Strongylus vulgaris]
MSCTVVIIYEVLSVFFIIKTMYAITKLAYIKAQKFWKETGLVVFVAIDCLLGAVDCIYETADLFGFKSSSNPVFQYINGNYALLLFLIVSMNSYSITFLSGEVRAEFVKFLLCWRKKAPQKRIAFSSSPSRIDAS